MTNITSGFTPPNSDLNSNNLLFLKNEEVIVSGSNLNIVTIEVLLSALQISHTGGVGILPGIDGYGYRFRDIIMTPSGTNFSGGDRNISISDTAHTVFFTIIPAAIAQSQIDDRWSPTSTALPFPITSNGALGVSNPGSVITVQFSSGTTNYTTGNLHLLIEAQLVKA